MSSPTNLIQYLFGKDAAGGDRGSVRDKLEKQKQLLEKQKRLENQTLDQSLINLGISTDDSKKINPLNPLDEYNNELFRQKFLGGNTSDLGDLRARQLNKDLIKERYIQQPLQNNNASAIRSQFRPDAFQRSEVGGYPGGIPSQKAPYFVSVDRSVDRSSDRNQIPMTRYPNYRDKRVVDAAIAMGKDTALDMNQETKKEGFIASLLGDIDFKSLAKSPLVMQALQGLSRMPTNQAQFGDSMVTGFTRGMQQFGAEEQARNIAAEERKREEELNKQQAAIEARKYQDTLNQRDFINRLSYAQEGRLQSAEQRQSKAQRDKNKIRLNDKNAVQIMFDNVFRIINSSNVPEQFKGVKRVDKPFFDFTQWNPADIVDWDSSELVMDSGEEFDTTKLTNRVLPSVIREYNTQIETGNDNPDIQSIALQVLLGNNAQSQSEEPSKDIKNAPPKTLIINSSID